MFFYLFVFVRDVLVDFLNDVYDVYYAFFIQYLTWYVTLAGVIKTNVFNYWQIGVCSSKQASEWTPSELTWGKFRSRVNRPRSQQSALQHCSGCYIFLLILGKNVNESFFLARTFPFPPLIIQFGDSFNKMRRLYCFEQYMIYIHRFLQVSGETIPLPENNSTR